MLITNCIVRGATQQVDDGILRSKKKKKKVLPVSRNQLKNKTLLFTIYSSLLNAL